ncbi:MAG TPA: TonB-dependent receptor [Prolixibacteraceae bacterium]|nr:TonB-dependent receptor [Prolixibacteraceae bacterium]
MKVTLFFFLIAIGSAFAKSSYSQNTRLSLHLQNATIQQVFDEIQKNSEFIIFYKDNQVDVNHLSNVNVVEGTVDQILDQALKSTSLGYKIIDRQIVILATDRKDTPSVNLNETEVQQKKDVSGTIKDNNGFTLPGVSVVVKGTTIGTITDNNGIFRISVPTDAKTLVFSFVGMKSQEILIGTKTNFTISLEEEVTGIEDVVVVGYGEQRKKDVTGATSTVKSDAITSRPITKIDQALQGTVPGVSVVSANGQPGQNTLVRIRGNNSITGGLDPLYVVDGFIGASISGIAPEEIESIQILKDASATAIYGSRGSNGVVLVTTKGGKEGKTAVNINTWMSQARMPRYVDVMNAYDFADTRNREDAIKGLPSTFSQDQLNAFKQPGASTDWQKEISQVAMTKNYQADVSGGTNSVKYLISGSYLDQQGVVINSWYKKASLRANLDIKASEKIDFKLSISGYESSSRNNFEGTNFNSPFGSAQTFNPGMAVKDADGRYIMASPYGNASYNPVAEANNNIHDYNGLNVQIIGLVNYHIFRNLTFTSTVGYQRSTSMNPGVSGPYTGAYALGQDGISIYNDKFWSFQNSNYFTYKLNFGEHAFTATALYEQQQQEYLSYSASDKQLSGYGNGYYIMGMGKSSTTGSGYWADAIQSFMGRVNYSFKDKYLATISLRDDGSSHLTDKYSLFPSLALGWNIANEKFMQDNKTISALKLRASYGKTGNQAIGAYATIPALQANGYYYFTAGQQSTVLLGGVVSSSLKWETTDQTNIGLDAAFYNNRLRFTADVYAKRINNLLYDYPASDYLGAMHGNLQTSSTYKKNLGTLDNRGLELSLGGAPVDGKIFKWNTNFNISFNRNKVIDMGGLDNILSSGNQNQESATILKVGMATGQFYGYQFLGTWKTEEAAEAAKFNAKPGSSKYVDVDGDKQYTDKDRMIIGHAQPKFSFGFTNDFSYSNFSLNIMFQGSQGNQIYSYSAAELNGGLGIAKDAASPDVKNNMWTPTKQTEFPVPGMPNDKTLSSRYVFDGSYIKLKNLSLSYRLPESILKSLKISKLEVYVSGQNILCITNYKGYDPETTYGASALLQGLESGSIPNPKTYTIGLRASF